MSSDKYPEVELENHKEVLYLSFFNNLQTIFRSGYINLQSSTVLEGSQSKQNKWTIQTETDL